MPEITADQLAAKAKAIDSAEAEYGVISHRAVDARKDFGAECVCARDHIIACLREHESRAAQWVDICIIEPTAPFITNVSAGWGKPALDSIEEELIDGDWENLPGVPPGAVSVRCKANHCAAQIGDEGRVELPAYWDLTRIGYEVMDDAGVSTYAAVEKAVRNG